MPATWNHPDLDEIAWNRFLVNNEKVRPYLHGEGERNGLYFELQTWRRDGWLGRLRMAGFVVRTLDDRIQRLGRIADDLELGVEGFYPIATSRDHIATWNPLLLRWQDLVPVDEQGQRGVRLYAHEPVRRRRSRGSGDYYIAGASRNGTINLRPIDERGALMRAYGLMTARDKAAHLLFDETSSGYHVPEDQALLPEPHRELLDQISQHGAPAWTFSKKQAFLAEQIFEKLGIELQRR